MAAENTPTTLGNLEFSQIKESLTNYLKNQSVFSGYNFEGSAIQTIIDLMAYNTFYYAYYANIINAEAFLDSAQKEDSMISLCKPLGFFVPSRTAPSASIKLSALPNNNTIPARSRFVASDSNGTEYSFYNLEDIPVLDQGTETFKIYEATRYVEFDAIANFDYDAQRINIADTNFDISSLKVTITETLVGDETYEQVWTPVDNIGYTARLNENIYFKERTSTGFSILFGSVNSVGRSIDSKITKIIVRYITTSGNEANGLSLFKTVSTSGLLTLVSESSGGKSNPDLDQVRFLAPKWFASQERAVTVNDYKALLLNSGFFNSDKEFNVFGGQDLTPPKYGRVFVTSKYDPSDSTVQDIIEFLKERSVITILPEYISPRTLEIYVDFKFSLGAGVENNDRNRTTVLSKVKSLFQSTYSTIGEFNVSFSASDFIDIIRASSDLQVSTIIISPDDFTIYVKQDLMSGEKYSLNLQNELYLPLNVSIPITEEFNSSLVASGSKAVLKMYARTNGSKNVRNALELWQITNEEETQVSANVGTFIASKGVIEINQNVIANTAILNAEFLKKSFSIKLDNLVSLKLGENVRVI